MQFRPALINYLSTGVKDQGPLFPWYDSTYINLASTSSLPTGWVLGQRWATDGPPKDAGGNGFQLVRAKAALAKGQLVALDAGTTGTVTAAGSTVAAIVTNVTASAANCFVDGFIYIAGATNTVRRIKANTSGANCTITVALTDPTIASKPNDPDVLAAIPANGCALTISMPYDVRVCTASLLPIGVAMGTVTSGNYTIIQVFGLAEVQVDGTIAAVYGVPLAPAATGTASAFAGTATALTGTAAPQFAQGATIVPLHAWATASVALVACMVNFTGA